jgi:hypothetical protein
MDSMLELSIGCGYKVNGVRRWERLNHRIWLILANRLNDLDGTYGYLRWFYRVIDPILATAAASRR